MYNYDIHKPTVLYEAFTPSEAKRVWDKFEFICTWKHGSWLKMQIELYVLMSQCLNHRIATMDEMKKE